MLAARIVPTILMKRRMQVKGVGFKADRVVGNALQAARIHAMRQVDELLILDVSATAEGREPDYDMITELTRSTFTPVTVGGGITELDQVQKLLESGADKVCIGSAYGLISQIAERFGSQCVSVALDVHVLIKGDPTQIVMMAKTIEDLGAGELLLQSVPRDGTMDGYDLNLIAAVSRSVSIPVVASGGCSGYLDMENALQAGADAVAAGALFLFTDATPGKAAEYLNNRNVEVRIA